MFNPDTQWASPAEITLRAAIEGEIERLIAVLDRFDGDPDFEDNGDYESEPDDEPNGDDEPWLGWRTLENGVVLPGATEDLEEEGR